MPNICTNSNLKSNDVTVLRKEFDFLRSVICRLSSSGSSSVTTNDTDTIGFSGDGSTLNPLTADAVISQEPENALVNNNGLYVQGQTTPQINTNERWALKGSGQNGCNVFFKEFYYPIGTEYTKCLYEVWARVSGDGYIWSDGYGGGHIMLLGTSVINGNGDVIIAGNVYNQYTPQSFVSWDLMKNNTVHHLAVMCNGANLIVYVDGVASAYLARTDPRVDVPSAGAGSGYLFGSDHQNSGATVFSMRIFENGLPFYSAGIDNHRHFSRYPTAEGEFCCLAIDFGNPYGDVFHDTTLGLNGVKHDGFRNFNVGGDPIYPPSPTDYLNVPQWVVDEIVQNEYSGSITPTPVGCKIFDAFERTDVVPVFQTTLTLGNTQGGSLGTKTWFSPVGGNAGIINTYAYTDAQFATYHLVTSDSPNQDIRLTVATSTTDKDISVYSNVTNITNHLFASRDTAGNVRLAKWVAGAYTVVGYFFHAAAVSELRLTVSSGIANVYCNGVNVITNIDVSDVPNSNNCGFATGSPYARVKKFEVY